MKKIVIENFSRWFFLFIKWCVSTFQNLPHWKIKCFQHAINFKSQMTKKVSHGTSAWNLFSQINLPSLCTFISTSFIYNYFTPSENEIHFISSKKAFLQFSLNVERGWNTVMDPFNTLNVIMKVSAFNGSENGPFFTLNILLMLSESTPIYTFFYLQLNFVEMDKCKWKTSLKMSSR